MNKLKSLLLQKYEQHREELINYFEFIELFSKISSDLYNQVVNLIRINFTSLTMFSVCMDYYAINDQEEDIRYTKNFLFNIACKSLKRDFSISSQYLYLNIDETYRDKRMIMYKLFELADIMGLVTETFDNLSYGVSYIKEINENTDGFISLKTELLDTNNAISFEYAKAYNDYIFMKRWNMDREKIHAIYNYYKCYVCKAGSLSGLDNNLIDIAKQELTLKYTSMSFADALFFYSTDYPSYLLSIVTYIFSKLLCLYYYSTESMYKIIDINEMKKEMLFGDYISDEDLQICINMIKHNSFSNNGNVMSNYFPFVFLDDENILLCKWMHTRNFNLLNDVLDICFNGSNSTKLGKIINKFGKNTYEQLVRHRIEGYGWKVLEHSLVLKDKNKQTITDIDVLAYNNGVVLIGQLKFAHSGYELYQKWKAEQTIYLGAEQCKKVINYIHFNKNDFITTLIEQKIVSTPSDVKHILPVVITSNNLLTQLPNPHNINVISLEMMDEILFYNSPDVSAERIFRIFNDPNSFYKMERKVALDYSTYRTNTFEIVRQEAT